MLLPLSWLAERLPGAAGRAGLAETFTDIGLEVEGVEEIKLRLDRVVAARVVAVAGDGKVRACEVDVGRRTPVSAACAAPNLRAGMTVAAALPGAVVNGVKVARR
ncbi:MAG: phenylalanine--tRNA ligase subunit beta, partial [Betaproteobacteria bacterium AqS2]|nr:phenylalanine--tRNA ligase subunit beta [Betaproteobacteria bacterium AqS2]